MTSPLRGHPVRVAHLLTEAMPGLAEHLVGERIRTHWQDIVGPEGGRRSRPQACSRGVLHVAVDNSPWLQELTLRSAEILKRVQASGGDGVTAVRFSLGRLPGDGARTERWRPAPPAVPLSSTERQEIEQLSAAVADPELAESLRRLLTKDWQARARRRAGQSQRQQKGEG